MSRAWWQRWARRGDALTPGVDPGVSFAWPDNGTDLTAEQIRIARDEGAAPSVLPPDAGPLPVETTASVAPRPQEWQPGPTPVLGGVVGEVDPEPGGSWTLVSSVEPNVWGEGGNGPAALLDYAVSRQELREMEADDAQARARNPDAFDDKRAIRQQLAACRGECGDGPPDYSEWPR